MSLSISLSPSRAAVYWAADRPFVSSGVHFPREQVANNERARPELSDKASKRIRKAINWLTFLSSKRRIKRGAGKFLPNFQISFITLTLPSKQMHSHKEIKSKCLNHFLVIAREKWGVKNYVWKAEIQVNGNIHFHITTDQYIPYMAIRREWNNCVSKLGYVSRYRDTFKNMSFQEYQEARRLGGETDVNKIRKAYQFGKRSDWSNPNSTDVHSVKHVKKLAAYMAKYLTKPVAQEGATGLLADSASSLSGRLWYCSQSLSKLASVILEFNIVNSSFVRALRTFKTVRTYSTSWVELLFFKLDKIPHKAREFIRQALVSHAVKGNYPFPSSTLRAGL